MTTSRIFAGAMLALGAVTIWASWMVVARRGLQSSLTPWDLTALRFATAGVLLLPVLVRQGLALDRLGWGGMAAIVAGGGAPMVLLTNAGLIYAPAAHGGALYSGTVPLVVSLLAARLLGERFTVTKLLGCLLIVSGAVGVAAGAGLELGTAQSIGHALFVTAGCSWACYTIALRRSRIDALHGAAIAAVGGLFLYIPLYLPIAGLALLEAPLSEVLIQSTMQGVLTAIVSLMLFGRAVAMVGASTAAAISALCPAMTALISIPVLGEWPSTLDTIAILAITVGAYIVARGAVAAGRAERGH